MQGEYRGDFTRDTFRPEEHFLRVLQQQGRVWLDADFNEQTSILLHYLQALAADLIGRHGGKGDGFKIEQLQTVNRDFLICPGNYYVDGIMCENEGQGVAYTAQRGYPFPDSTDLKEIKQKTFCLIFLDVWERHITHVEDEEKDKSNPSIREVALGGPDTATRSKVVWQVKVVEKLPDRSNIPSERPQNYRGWDDWAVNYWLDQFQRTNRGQLRARAKTNSDENTDPCITSPDARYRGAENQLYRVEIHNGGTAGKGATVKWSRENGSVVFPIRKLATSDSDKVTTVTLENLGRDQRFGLAEGDWVEIVDDDYALQNRAEPLLQVKSIDRDKMTVTLTGAAPGAGSDLGKHPLLRRWDQKKGDPTKGWPTLQGGVALVQESTGTDGWLTLEDGVQIQFQPGGNYRTGDYWLIPARTPTGDVEWPGPVSNPDALPPHGVEHHYAPLAIISVGADGAVTPTDVRRKFSELAQ
jgi:hypothetical protein